MKDQAVAMVSVSTPESGMVKKPSVGRKFVQALTWCPPRCRWDPDNPPEFSMALNILFGFSGAFTVANLYYNHPILNVLAHDFGVPYEKVAQIPTVMQAGYAAGLLFLCPLGDSLPRRPFTLSLVFFTATMWSVVRLHTVHSQPNVIEVDQLVLLLGSASASQTPLQRSRASPSSPPSRPSHRRLCCRLLETWPRPSDVHLPFRLWSRASCWASSSLECSREP